MALPNTEKLTSQLATLPDVALRQMAQMHKNDPYILPLVIAEDSRRKQMRAASQAQRGAMPQPKVVDAAVQQVGQLPEEVGIGALPTPNMTQMAGGGITGDDYDMVVGEPSSVPGFAGGGDSGVYERWKAMSTPYSGRVWGESPTAFSDFLSGVGQSVAEFVSPEQAEADRKKAAEMAAAEERMRGYRPRRSGSETEQALEERMLEARAGVGVPGPETSAGAMQNVPSPVPDNRRTPAGAGAAPRTSMQSLDALYESYRKKYGPGAEQVDPFAKERKAITEAKTSERKQALEEFEKDVAARTPFGAEREKRLIAKEEKLGRDEGQLGGLALLEAGLAIMSGTSQYAAANIGAGAGVGLKAYKQGKKEIEDARDKLDDARSLIDEYRRNEAEMTKKERRGLQKDIRSAQTEGLESLLSGMEKVRGESREDLKTLLGAAALERSAHIKGGYELQAAGIRAEAGQGPRMAALAQRTLADIEKAAQKQYPYSAQAAQRDAYMKTELAKALQYNPDLAQYMGAAGGGGATTTTDYSKWGNPSVK